MSKRPRITFGVIVLNGEPLTKYCLRALYPYAHEIIVVEGACEAAAGVATADGHSTDTTLQSLREFQEQEDEGDKLRIVTRDGFWPEKDEMSQAYAEHAKGDYLWQVDIDEFYQPEEMEAVLDLLASDPTISGLSFPQIQFWGSFSTSVDGWFMRGGLPEIRRVFRWGPGHTYTTHRPPTVVDAKGNDTYRGNWLRPGTAGAPPVTMYHYSFVFPKQVREKCAYYGRAQWAERSRAEEWAESVYLNLSRPYRVHNVYGFPGWLDRFMGDHPPQIELLRRDIRQGAVQIDLRGTEDIERLLASWWYPVGRWCLKAASPPGYHAVRVVRRLRQLVTDPRGFARFLSAKLSRTRAGL
ncbi:glycosyltransferase family A protein [Planctomycetota bacterium]